MKHQISAVGLWLTLFSMGASAGFSAGIPDIIHKADNPGGPPAWISEEALKEAMDSGGLPVGSRLGSVGHLFEHRPPVLSSRLDLFAREGDFVLSPDGGLVSCEPISGSEYYGERAKDLRQLVQLSEDVSRVRVLGSKPGFRYGDPGELLEIEVLSVLRDSGSTGVPRRGFYLFDRYARMVIDGKPLCVGDRQVPEGEYLLFQIWADFPQDLGLPSFFLDASALVAADGTYFGSLLDSSVEPGSLAGQLSTLDGLLSGQP